MCVHQSRRKAETPGCVRWKKTVGERHMIPGPAMATPAGITNSAPLDDPELARNLLPLPQSKTRRRLRTRHGVLISQSPRFI